MKMKRVQLKADTVWVVPDDAVAIAYYDYTTDVTALGLCMVCYELRDGRLLRIDNLEEWQPTEGHALTRRIPLEDRA